MTVDQFKTAINGLSNRVYGSRTFRIDGTVILFLLTVISRTIRVLDGQPNLPALEFTTLDDAVTQIRLLASPTNGHKLQLPTPVVRLLAAMFYRTARDENDKVIVGTYAS